GDAKPVYGRQFQAPFADRIRHEAGVATMAVGNISSYSDVNTLLAAGRADLCVLARAHLWYPYWTRHAAHEMGYELPWPNPYETLNQYKPRFQWMKVCPSPTPATSSSTSCSPSSSRCRRDPSTTRYCSSSSTRCTSSGSRRCSTSWIICRDYCAAATRPGRSTPSSASSRS